MRKLLSFVIGFALANFVGSAQAPILSDPSSQIYTLSTTISPLSIINSGGQVPVDVQCKIATYAGKGSYGSEDGNSEIASFNGLAGVATDLYGNVYVADTGNNKIRKISAKGQVITIAGNGTTGSVDGNAAVASFDGPFGLAVDLIGNIFVADSNNNKIRKISPNGTVTTFAGTGAFGSADGIGTSASFDHPYGVAVDNAGNVYVADTGNHKIRKITTSGVVSTLAGSGISGDDDEDGQVASFKFPFGVTAAASGDIYVADTSNNKIRKISANGFVTTLAGSGNLGATDGDGAGAAFKYPFAVAADVWGNVFVADSQNQMIRKISPDGYVNSLAGSGKEGAEDGTDLNSGFNYPRGLATDVSGNLYVGDYMNNKIRKISVFGYAVLPALPVGLNLDPKTGIISGTPAVLSEATDYIVTAKNAYGTGSAKVNITVKNANNGTVSEPGVDVYPNPVEAVLNIKPSKDLSLQNLQVIDTYGKIIFMTNNTSQIDVQSLKSGVYILRAEGDGKSVQMKFIKS